MNSPFVPLRGNLARVRTLVEMDLRFHFTRPLFWILVGALVLLTWGLSSGNVSISSGDSTIGGQSRAWITSEFTIAFMFPTVTFLLYSFFVAVGSGMLVPRDDELEVGPVLHATRLEPGEYVWGRVTAAGLMFAVILALHLLATMFFFQVMPNANAELIRGPFVLMNYVRPALVMAVPFLVFLLGASFAVGEWTRKPIVVFATPMAFFLVSIFFLWFWSPSWLDPGINNLLGWIEPSGFRWLNETWLTLDRGVEFYNNEPVGYDVPFLLSRLAYFGLGIALVVLSKWHFAATLRGSKDAGKPRRRWFRRRPASAEPSGPADAGAVLLERPLAAFGMVSRVPGFLRTMWDVARFEARNLRGQPGLYIFVPLILFQTIGSTFTRVGGFGESLLLTPGTAAVSSMNTLTMLVCFLILFYTVESVNREWATGLSSMYWASAARTAAVLSGKAIANAVVGVVILLGCYTGAMIVMLFQGKVTPVPGPFLLVWGLLLVPTFVAWSTFVTAAFALTRNRYATYGVGLAVMAYTGWKQTQGEMNWVGNWTLWSTVTWTDFGALEPNGSALLLNRLFYLTVAAFLVALTVRVFPRREWDSGRIVDRLRPKSLLGAAWRLAPVALPAIVLGVTLGVQVSQGFQGKAPERREEEYHGRNLVTWLEAETPRFAAVDVDLELEPDDGWFKTSGTYELVNNSEEPMRRFPMSIGDHFENVEWTLDGESFEPENWARMHVFELAEPLAPGARLRLGFSLEGHLPRGINENGGGMPAFIVSSGVVLRSFSSEFLPVPYFEGGRGVDQDNQVSPRDYEEGFWEGRTRPLFGGGSRYPVRMRITGPERFLYNSVGVLESETVTDGKRTVVWRTDHPVNFFNVVASDWEVWDGEGVKIFYHPEHTYNLEEMQEALTAARKYYSEWFYPYPWEELKLSEFPALAGYAQGFPTNITFSESIGFLTRSTPEAELAFMVTAHESAHQWWGNILLPGQGPGANILSEGMAHFSTTLLFEEVKGERGRIEFLKRIEERYGDNRQVDSERPLVWIDGSKAGDTTVTYDKGGWVFWMLLNHMGREAGMAGYRDFIHRYAVSDDYPVLQDFIAVMREHAADVEAFDAFVEQWFLDVQVPQYRFTEAEVRQDGDGWIVTATVENAGSARVAVEIAAERGERFPTEDDQDDAEPWHAARKTVVLGEGESATVEIRCGFEPERVLVDPDAMVLMLEREKAVRELG